MCNHYSEIISFVDRQFETLTAQAHGSGVDRSCLYRCLFKARSLRLETWQRWRNYILGMYAYTFPVSASPVYAGWHHGADSSTEHNPAWFVWMMMRQGKAIIVFEYQGDVACVEHIKYDASLKHQQVLELLRDRVDLALERRNAQ